MIANLSKPTAFARHPMTWLMIACLTTGCGGEEGLERAEVTGKVTFDGRPIENGSISFRLDGGRDYHKQRVPLPG